MENQFAFLHDYDGTEIIVRFKSVYTNDVIEQFINFMRACDYCDDTIYETMSGLVESYYSRKQREPLGLPDPQDEVA